MARATSGIWRILFCGAEQPLTSTIEDDLNITGGKHVLAMFIKKNYFE